MARTFPWIAVAAALAGPALSACDVQGAGAPAHGPVDLTAHASTGSRVDSATIAVDLPESYAPPGCDDTPNAGGRV